MRHLFLWALTGLAGFTSLQATNASIDSSEAGCHRPNLIDLIDNDPSLIPVEPTFAYVYNNNAKTKPAGNDGYLVQSPIIFNSKGPAEKITFDRTTGELIVPVAGTYEIKYAVSSGATYESRKGYKNFVKDIFIDFMALEVNGQEVRPSRVSVRIAPRTATFVLNLAQGDHVGLILPGTSESKSILSRDGGEGNSAYLMVKKL
jgi:hypothetical protein